MIWLLPTGLRLDPVSDGFESLTLKMYFDGMVHLLTGGLGTFTLTAEGRNYGRIQWEFTGQYQAPADEPLPTPVHETTLRGPGRVGAAALRRLRGGGRCGLVYPGERHPAAPRLDASDAYNGVRIVGRALTAGVDPEAALVADHDFWGRMTTGQRMPFQMRVGTAAGNTVWMLAPVTQYSGLTYRDRTGLRTYDAGLKMAHYAGDDEVLFAFV